MNGVLLSVRKPTCPRVHNPDRTLTRSTLTTRQPLNESRNLDFLIMAGYGCIVVTVCTETKYGEFGGVEVVEFVG